MANTTSPSGRPRGGRSRTSAKASRSRPGADNASKSGRVDMDPAVFEIESTALVPIELTSHHIGAKSSVIGSSFLEMIAWKRSIDPAKLRFVQIVGDSMAPSLNPGDEVLIEETDHLSSSGLWVIWDGLCETVRQIESVPNFCPTRVTIKPHNKSYATY